MTTTTLTFDPDDTSDRTFVVDRHVSAITVIGGGSHYNDDDPTFTGGLFESGAALRVDRPPFNMGDVLRIRLGGPGRGGIGGFNGGGSSPAGTASNYGLGGGGCTELWCNDTLFAVAAGQGGGYRFEIPDYVIQDPWYVDSFRRLFIASALPAITDEPRLVHLMPETIDAGAATFALFEDAWPAGIGPRAEGDPGGDHDGADGIPDAFAGGDGPLGFTTGAGGGGWGGGASGGAGYYVSSPTPGVFPDWIMWARGKCGGSYLAVDTTYKFEVPGLDGWFAPGSGDVGQVIIEQNAPSNGWRLGSL